MLEVWGQFRKTRQNHNKSSPLGKKFYYHKLLIYQTTRPLSSMARQWYAVNVKENAASRQFLHIFQIFGSPSLCSIKLLIICLTKLIQIFDSPSFCSIKPLIICLTKVILSPHGQFFSPTYFSICNKFIHCSK